MAALQETVVQLIDRAGACGATLVGIVSVADLKQAAAARAYAVDVDWLADGKSVLVIGLAHPAAEPEMDWWGTENGTSGNHLLKQIGDRVRAVLAKEFGIRSRSLKYQPGDQGVFLKDAAVLAGLGCIGANNLLLTAQHGANIRLRALLLEIELPGSAHVGTGSPCTGCEHMCWQACPQQAFASGVYERSRCRIQMRRDELNRSAVETARGWVTYVKYCRACELACPFKSSEPLSAG